MFIQEELEKKKIQNEAMDNMLDLLFEILPSDENTDLIKNQHNFQKLDKKVLDKVTNKELTKEQTQELTSAYKQMKKIIEDILNK